MGKTLFIRNGVNRLTDNTSWEQVLDSLAKFAPEPEHDLIMRNIRDKPFTLVFEEIFLRSAKARHTTEFELKKEAARLINNIPNSEYHAGIIKTGAKHILTTNYDYNLERGSGVERKDACTHPEQKYSLFRRYQVGSQWVWHIHGEASVPDSLALGHNHYAGSLHHIRDYLVTRSTRVHQVQRRESPYLGGDPNFDSGVHAYSWLDVFLRDDIHIYGFSLDYTEIELWWLLSFKERERLSPRRPPSAGLGSITSTRKDRNLSLPARRRFWNHLAFAWCGLQEMTLGMPSKTLSTGSIQVTPNKGFDWYTPVPRMTHSRSTSGVSVCRRLHHK